MKQYEKIVEFLRVPEGKPELVSAQLKALTSKVPFMYGFVIISVIALSYTHYPYVPWWLSTAVPVLFVGISLARFYAYFRIRGRTFDEAETRRRLNITALLSFCLSLLFMAWTLSLMQHGTPYTQAHVICFAVVTGIGNAASLMHVRAAIVGMLAGAVLPLVVFLALSGNVVYVAMGVNILIVVVAILMVLIDSNRDFEKLVDFSVKLQSERTAAQDLSRVNFELANVDSLTGLQNRRGFFSTLGQGLKRDSDRTALAIGVLDLDGFKPINDIYGHPMGDQVLREVAQRLRAFDPSAPVARLGGDEFGLVLSSSTGPEGLPERGRQLCEVMRAPFRMNDVVVQLSASLGMSQVGPDRSEIEEAFKRADYALYHAKNHDNGSAVLFSEVHAAEIREGLGVERRLRDGDFEREMTLAYQLIYDTDAGKSVGAEALARWMSPAIGSIAPDVFIPAAERCGLIGRLTEVLFRKTLSDMSGWPDNIFVSFNLSAHDICAPESIQRLVDIAARAGIDPKRLTFEITETAVMQDFGRAQESLRILKFFGAKIALDDFGTGQSSLSYLHTLPLDRVKIDRSFIAQIEHSLATRAIVETILDLCTKLGLDCIIEGVESEGQLLLMQELGCTTFQGYLFSRPHDPQSVQRILFGERDADDRARDAARIAYG